MEMKKLIICLPVKMMRKTHSHTSKIASFRVPVGSSGDSHAIVTQLRTIMVSTTASKGPDSTRKMAVRRGSCAGRIPHSDVLSKWPAIE